MTIKAVFFDVGNTLMNFNYEAIANHVPALRVEQLEERGPAAWKSLNGILEKARIEGTHVDVLRCLFKELLLERGQPELIETLIDKTDTCSLWNKVNHHARDAIATLKAGEICVAVISNADGQVESLLNNHGWVNTFEFIIDSGLVGVSKPSVEIFNIALDKARLKPSEVLYVGDLPAVDVYGAQSAGLNPVLYDPYDQHDAHWRLCTASDRRAYHRITHMNQLASLVNLLNG
jgi:putative hydrolase of the HAD superfamily